MIIIFLWGGLRAACHRSCLTCTAVITFCLTCPATRTLSSNSCLCQLRTYDDGSNTACANCNYKCGSCSSTSSNCISCQTSDFRSLSGTTCLCNSNYYDNGLSVCAACHFSCLTCSSGSASNCLSCNSANSRIFISGKCGCLFGFYDQGISTCQACNAACLGCTAATNTGCLSCAARYTLALSACLICDARCLSCSSDTTTCLSCDISNIRDLDSGRCECKLGYFENGGALTCDICHFSCRSCKIQFDYCQSCESTSYRIISSNKCPCVNRFFQSGQRVCNSCMMNCYRCSAANICLQCIQDFLMSYNQDICDTACPIGQYNQQGSLSCKICYLGCSSCSIDFCNTCSYGFSRDSSGFCYLCLCSNCIDTICGSCASSLFSLKGFCYSLCPYGYFSKVSQCLTCPQNCKVCKNQSYCSQCFTRYFGLKGQCLRYCPSKFYPELKNNTCSECTEKQYLNNQICRSYQSQIKVNGFANNPFSQSQFYISLVSEKSILQQSVNGSYQISISQRGRTANSCFTAQACCFSDKNFKIRIKNLGCKVIDMKIEFRLLDNGLGTSQFIPFKGHNYTFTWPINLPNLYPYYLLQQVSKAFPYVSYHLYLPLLLFFVPSLRIFILFYFLDSLRTFQLQQLLALLASLAFSVGLNLTPVEWVKKIGITKFNTLNRPMGTAAFTLNFLQDSAVFLAYLIILAAIKLVSMKIFQRLKLIDASFAMANQGLMLLLLTSCVLQFQNFKIKDWYSVLNLVAAVLFMIYWCLYLISNSNEVSLLSEMTQVQKRLLKAQECPQLLDGLSLSSSQNSHKGILFFLNPIFFRVQQTFLDTLLILVVSAVAVGWVQLSSFVLYYLFKLVRGVFKPFAYSLINYFILAESILMLALMALVFASNYIVNRQFNAPKRTLLQDLQAIDLWDRLGWVQVALVLAAVTLSVVRTIISRSNCNQDSKFRLIGDNSSQDLDEQLKTYKLQKIMISQQPYIQQEFQSIIAHRKKDIIFLKIRVVQGLTVSKVLSYLKESISVQSHATLRSFMQLPSQHPFFDELAFLLDQFSSDNTISIRSLSSLRLDKVATDVPIRPELFYQIVEGNQKKEYFRGPKALIWLPINKNYI